MERRMKIKIIKVFTLSFFCGLFSSTSSAAESSPPEFCNPTSIQIGAADGTPISAGGESVSLTGVAFTAFNDSLKRELDSWKILTVTKSICTSKTTKFYLKNTCSWVNDEEIAEKRFSELQQVLAHDLAAMPFCALQKSNTATDYSTDWKKIALPLSQNNMHKALEELIKVGNKSIDYDTVKTKVKNTFEKHKSAIIFQRNTLSKENHENLINIEAFLLTLSDPVIASAIDFNDSAVFNNFKIAVKTVSSIEQQDYLNALKEVSKTLPVSERTNVVYHLENVAMASAAKSNEEALAALSPYFSPTQIFRTKNKIPMLSIVGTAGTSYTSYLTYDGTIEQGAQEEELKGESESNLMAKVAFQYSRPSWSGFGGYWAFNAGIFDFGAPAFKFDTFEEAETANEDYNDQVFKPSIGLSHTLFSSPVVLGFDYAVEPNKFNRKSINVYLGYEFGIFENPF